MSNVRRCPPPAENAHRLVKVLWALMIAEGMSRVELERQSGISESQLSYWWRPGSVGHTRRGQRGLMLHNIEACFNVLGYSLKPTPIIIVDSEADVRPHGDSVREVVGRRTRASVSRRAIKGP